MTKMAGLTDSQSCPFETNPIFDVLDSQISQILRKSSSTSIKDITEELSNDFELDLLEEARSKVFDFAISRLNEQYMAIYGENIAASSIILKKRRIVSNVADDLVQLCLYVGGRATLFCG